MNRLAQESSLYLQQHAHNPVDWWPWCPQALQTAQEQNKPIILSIGYSSCHWCHVMERETFEKHEVAELMNMYFVCIKVDREERPDIDQIYMDAIHLMGIRGGWPLNVFLFPDGSPFYGGTYFPKDHWIHLLLQIKDAWRNHNNELKKSALAFRDALKAKELNTNHNFKITSYQKAFIDDAFDELQKKFDTKYGGIGVAPKFPMPCIWEFVAAYAHYTKSKVALDQLTLTLDSMAYGGIYDHLGGGFARYSTDSIWLVPHFEKMLYDNAQLLNLYTNAFKITKKPLYKEIIKNLVIFLESEMQSTYGAFYSSIDADSEGVEGKFYVWTEDEIDYCLGQDSALFKQFYHISKEGNWESGLNILYRTEDYSDFAKNKNWDENLLIEKLNQCQSILFAIRNKRQKPTLDTKILTTWNALTVSALCNAYSATGEDRILKMIEGCIDFIRRGLILPTGQVKHLYVKNQTCLGYLDDYASVCESLLSAYQIIFDESLLNEAKKVADYAIENFYDFSDGLFFYSGKDNEQLIAQKKEIFDNVIPSSNSMMARSLRVLGKLLSEERYINLSQAMLERIVIYIPKNIEFMANWGLLYLENLYGDAEIAIVGPNAYAVSEDLRSDFIPGVVIAASAFKSHLPLLHQRYREGQTLIYVCRNKTCGLPVETIEAAREQLLLQG